MFSLLVYLFCLLKRVGKLRNNRIGIFFIAVFKVRFYVLNVEANCVIQLVENPTD